MELNHLPIIDWELSKKLAGNRVDLAKDMLNLLIQGLADELEAIHQSHQEKNYPELHQRLHKLHGALCYCGLPRLKTIVTKLETAIKTNVTFSLPSLLKQLQSEVDLLLEHYSHQTKDVKV